MEYLREIFAILSLDIVSELKKFKYISGVEERRRLEIRVMFSVLAVLGNMVFVIVIVMYKLWDIEFYKVVIHSVANIIFYFNSRYLKNSFVSERIKLHIAGIMTTIEYLLGSVRKSL